MHFELMEEIRDVEVIVLGRGIGELGRPRRRCGEGRWRRMRGRAMIRLAGGRVRLAELHWHEAHGPGRKEIKRKRYLD